MILNYSKVFRCSLYFVFYFLFIAHSGCLTRCYGTTGTLTNFHNLQTAMIFRTSEETMHNLGT